MHDPLPLDAIIEPPPDDNPRSGGGGRKNAEKKSGDWGVGQSTIAKT
jgi:hypothetical protein